MDRYRRRKLKSRIYMTLSVCAALFGLAWLAMILFALIWNGAGGLSPSLFTKSTPPPPGDSGGLGNAVVGSLIMTSIAMLIGTPIGILAGTYMAEYGRYTYLTKVTRFVNDILLSAPSIIVGLFIYEIVVARAGHFSGYAGALALALLVIPIVIRTTETMLLLVPDSLREAAAGLGSTRWIGIWEIIYKSARAGILTGIILAFARIAGGTAPLLFTALSNQFWSINLNGPMASLPVTIYQFAGSPYPGWQKLAWTGALLITLAVLFLNIVARALTSQKVSR